MDALKKTFQCQYTTVIQEKTDRVTWKAKLTQGGKVHSITPLTKSKKNSSIIKDSHKPPNTQETPMKSFNTLTALKTSAKRKSLPQLINSGSHPQFKSLPQLINSGSLPQFKSQLINKLIKIKSKKVKRVTNKYLMSATLK
jgi:hypothetical protein